MDSTGVSGEIHGDGPPGRRWWDRCHHSVRNADGNDSRTRVNDLKVNELEHLTFDRETVVRQHLDS